MGKRVKKVAVAQPKKIVKDEKAVPKIPKRNIVRIDDGETSASSKKKRKTDKERKTDKDEADQERAHRAVKNKMKYMGIPYSQWSVARNSMGQQLVDCLIDEYERMEKAGVSYVQPKFWTDTLPAFKLVAKVDLPAPTKDLTVRKELGMALKRIHAENFADRKLDKFTKFLEYSGELTDAELYGILMNSLPCSTMSQKMSHEMHMVILSHLAETGGHIEHKEYFELFMNSFDFSAGEYWKLSSGTGMSSKSFVEGNADALGLLIDVALALSVIKQKEEKVTPDVNHVKKLLQTKIGKALFADEEAKLEWINFMDDINKRRRALRDVSFERTDVEAFKKIMTETAESLAEDGFAQWDEKEEYVVFLGLQQKSTLEQVNDAWKKNLDAEAKSCALNQLEGGERVLTRAPWEKLCFGDDPIPGVPEHVKVPPELLKKACSARNAARDMLGPDVDTMTLDQMAQVLCTKDARKTLRKMDPTIDLELDFLEQNALPVFVGRCQAKVLAPLPVQGVKPGEIGDVLTEVDKVLCDPVFSLLPLPKFREIQTCRKILDNLLIEEAPRPSDVVNFSQFEQKCLQRIGNFCYTKADGKTNSGRHMKAIEDISGKQAMTAIMDGLIKKYSAKGAVCQDSKELELLKKFGWLVDLKHAQFVTRMLADFKEWQSKQILTARRKSLTDLEKKSGKPAENKKTCAKASAKATNIETVIVEEADGAKEVMTDVGEKLENQSSTPGVASSSTYSPSAESKSTSKGIADKDDSIWKYFHPATLKVG